MTKSAQPASGVFGSGFSFGDLFQAGGTALDVFGAYQTSKSVEQEALYNEAITLQVAAGERMWARSEVYRMAREEQLLRGSNLASAGASGVAVNSGSFLDLLADDTVQAELDRRVVMAQAATRATQADSQAALYRYRASNESSNRPLSLLGRAVQGATPIFARRL